MLNRRIIIFTACASLTFFCLYYAIAPQYLGKERNIKNATILKSNRPLQNFQLSSTLGKEFNLQDLRGHWTLMFFGYMACPDICPKTLGTLADTWDIFQQKKRFPTNFVFASIDTTIPEQRHFHDFLTHYNPKFIGIFGNQEHMRNLTTQLGIYTKKEGNIIDHSSALILLDPRAQIKAIITPPFDAKILAADLEKLTK